MFLIYFRRLLSLLKIQDYLHKVKVMVILFQFLHSEQLEKIETGMDSINADMQIAEKALKGMELCCGIFPKFWKK